VLFKEGESDKRTIYLVDGEIELRVGDRTVSMLRAGTPEARIEHLHGASIASHGELPYLPEKLWPDLLGWARGWYGERWAKRARRAMRLAAGGRLALRRVREAFLAGERRRRFRQATAELARGYEALAARPR
jgi:hypothetical protein